MYPPGRAKKAADHFSPESRCPMAELAAALAKAAHSLAAVSETPRLDAELLMAHTLGLDRSAMLGRMRDLAVPPEFAVLISRRMAHEPVAYIRGCQDFWDLTLTVTPDVLIPRGDSETLIEAARIHFEDRPPKCILDLGTGSGALLLAALSLFPQAQGVAIDASARALVVAQGNADRLGFTARCTFLKRSWRDAGWQNGLGTFDLILCNPPYVETTAKLAPQVRDHEPATALFAGEDGLDDYKCLIPQIPELMNADGVAIFELGQGQDTAVAEMATSQGLTVQQHQDLASIVRALSLSKSYGG
jgi:release factor glutamine methyltransferase